jgi:uncharacterized membrane protein YkvI
VGLSKNPYQGVEVKYGSGSWTHYFEQLPYLLGLVVLVLFVLSHGVWFRELLKKRLVLVPLLCFLLFWGFLGRTPFSGTRAGFIPLD